MRSRAERRVMNAISDAEVENYTPQKIRLGRAVAWELTGTYRPAPGFTLYGLPVEIIEDVVVVATTPPAREFVA